MTATILLIRHAAHAHLGQVLSGRTPGIALSDAGLVQAVRLARRLATEPIARIQASPVQRARETAETIAALQPGLTVETADALDELDFGDWSGRAFTELAGDPLWDNWNRERSNATTPGGETMSQVQQRAWLHVRRTAAAHSGMTLAMVTHCDVIRAVVASVLRMSLDDLMLFEIGPASVTRIAVGDWGARILTLNEGFHE